MLSIVNDNFGFSTTVAQILCRVILNLYTPEFMNNAGVIVLQTVVLSNSIGIWYPLAYKLPSVAIDQANLWQEDSRPTWSSIVRSSVLAMPCLGTFSPYSAYVPCFTPAAPIRYVFCVGHTPRAWHPRSQQSMLYGPLYFGL